MDSKPQFKPSDLLTPENLTATMTIAQTLIACLATAFESIRAHHEAHKAQQTIATTQEEPKP